MLVTDAERQLCQILQDLPAQYGYRYTATASWKLREALFNSLAANKYAYLRGFFHGKIPNYPARWSLREAQGMTEDMEYTEAARGRPCGHIFKNGDTAYHCKTCTTDETCVLCTRCFEASDHAGHIFTQSISLGNTGCCDCGDEEAWRLPVKCAIHTAHSSGAMGKEREAPGLPDELLQSIRMTIGRSMDYLIDVLSCSPENLRYAKTERSIREDEQHSRLDSGWYRDSETNHPEFALVLWNDEKHTIPEVEQQVSRACKKAIAYGREKAHEINDTGRSVIEYSTDVQKLLKIAEIIEQIKLTVTIRSARDAFREQMCGTIIEWLGDIAGCGVGDDHDILRRAICEEILRPWRMGSEASNKWLGKNGLDDHEIDEADKMTDLVNATLARAGRQHALTDRMRAAARAGANNDDDDNGNDIDDEDDEDTDSVAVETTTRRDSMDVDMAGTTITYFDLPAPGELEDDTEVSEATYAGYPPPPPPPPVPAQILDSHERTQHPTMGSDHREIPANVSSSTRPDIEIPVTPWRPRKNAHHRPPAYWLDPPDKPSSQDSVPLYEDLRQRIRLDWLLLYDLRLWKVVRIGLRDLYISTVVSVPHFKRILGLRFAGLYGVLAQLYLVADREPDHSIVNLSVQTFTTPSITREIVERGNFLTTLFSILYTFLTKRTVQHPWQVSVDDALNFDHGAVANRRMYHFFHDLKHIFGIEYVQHELRTQERYVLQFLDLVRLPQGICPNTRAVGEHVEYESDTWIAAQLLTKEINTICRQFAEIFDRYDVSQEPDLARVIRIVAKAAIINSLGAERERFHEAELRAETHFETLIPFSFENNGNGPVVQHSVVDYVIEREPISFHHALHYTLSWLVDAGKSISIEKVRSLLSFTQEELSLPPPTRKSKIPKYSAEDYLMALFDFPLRVCAWLAQMKAGMWVRNGISLRHQMTTYRGVSHRDLAHHRDLFLLQTALVVCEPSRVLASMIDRFGMNDWMRGHYILRDGFELCQQLDVAEDFVHLMIVLLSDRTSLRPLDSSLSAHTLAIRRDITHILCFKPLSFSELNNRFANKATDLEEFQDILDEMTIYRPPESLSDTGSFELKQEYLADVDPYTAHYTKNQRDEAENAYRKWMAQKTGKSASDIVYEPKVQPIEHGIFRGLASFTKQPLFAQIIFYALACGFDPRMSRGLPLTRIESYLQVVLHLVLLAVFEDETRYRSDLDYDQGRLSFVDSALHRHSELGHTILDILVKILENDEMKACHAKTRLVLHRMSQKRLHSYDAALRQMYADGKYAPVIPMDSLGFESPRTPMDDDQEARQHQAREMKKKQALDRQARVMAQMQQQQQNFINNQAPQDWEGEESEVEGAILGNMEEQTKTWKYPTGNCILCQEEANDSKLFGTFALMTNSAIFRETDSRDPDFLREVLSTPDNLDRSADDVRPFGLASENRYTAIKRAADGHEFESVEYCIGRGFPSNCSTRAPVSTGCGHIMHYSCFNTYCHATRRRQEHQVARNHPERTKRNEFVCPLCKALGNTFLPIIWKNKEEAYPGALETHMSFEEWLSSGVGLSISRFFKNQEGRANDSRRQESFASYTYEALVPSLTALVLNHADTPVSSPVTPSSAGRVSLQGMPGVFPTEGLGSYATSPLPPAMDIHPFRELTAIFKRLHETINVDDLASAYPDNLQGAAPSDDFGHTDTLARTLGYSIIAAEIAQRGTQSEPGQTLLEKIPSSLLTHLRIFSETVSSYIAIGGMRDGGRSAAAFEFSDTANHQIVQLFAGHPQIVGNALETVISQAVPAALSLDPFVFLTECSVYLASAANVNIHHLLRLCYLLEMVKMALYFTSVPETLETLRSRSDMTERYIVPARDLDALHGFVSRLSMMSSPRWPMMENYTSPLFHQAGNSDGKAGEMYAMVHTIMSKYALSFVRKVAILLHVRYGVVYPDTGFADMDDVELVRLSRLLRLPSLYEIYTSLQHDNANDNGGGMLTATITGWIQHWQYAEGHHNFLINSPDQLYRDRILRQSAYEILKPGHPAIFELIGLPKHFDTLTHEATKRRCPTKGGKLEDPALCLFCGAMFCSQALCCASKDGKGGANQHMQKCGVDIGLFLNIRKCCVLYLHRQNGSWNMAPYIDRYGESDPGLRRGRQLSLNQKRYDALFRNVWLSQGIPTMIARKLEPDINNGGWETM